jgi:predicted acyltransferase (DUF342 family)
MTANESIERLNALARDVAEKTALDGAPGKEFQEIFPRSAEDLDREMTVGMGSRVRGGVYGCRVIVQSGAMIEGHVVGRTEIDVYPDAQIRSLVVCPGSVRLQHRCVVGGVAAGTVKLGGTVEIAGDLATRRLDPASVAPSTQIGGTLLVDGSIELGARCKVNRIVSSGDVTIGQDSEISELVVGGNLVLEKAVRFERAWVGTGVESVEPLRCSELHSEKNLRLPAGSQVEAASATGTIKLGDGCQVDSVSGSTIEVGSECKFRLLFGRVDVHLHGAVSFQGGTLVALRGAINGLEFVQEAMRSHGLQLHQLLLRIDGTFEPPGETEQGNVWTTDMSPDILELFEVHTGKKMALPIG